MKKILFGIFAHPDDEAFGPVAALLDEAEKGTELHLVTITAGENGTNPDNESDLGAVRLQEWRAAGKLIGAASLHHFGYIDGTLNNLSHLEITSQIQKLVHEIVAGRDEVEIEFMSLDLNGFSGHIDHIVASRSTCLAFYRLREHGLPVTKVRLACLPREVAPSVGTSFVFTEPGRTPNEIDETVDGTRFMDKIHEIMQCHHSQRGDYEAVASSRGNSLGINYFIVKN
jgi:LmbE family N-acetylglucosaminyl deacetylase